jgi:Tfp pilus assembly protein PilO
MKQSSAFILILISIGLFYTFITPQKEKVKTLKAQADEYNNVLDSVTELQETRDALMQKYESLPQAEIDQLTKILPDHVDNVRLALDIDGIAARYGISIRTIQTETEVVGDIFGDDNGKVYEKVTVTFSFASNYANFRKFLADLEKSLRLIDVKSVGFQATDNGIYDYKISFDTYWLK